MLAARVRPREKGTERSRKGKRSVEEDGSKSVADDEANQVTVVAYVRCSPKPSLRGAFPGNALATKRLCLEFSSALNYIPVTESMVPEIRKRRRRRRRCYSARQLPRHAQIPH